MPDADDILQTIFLRLLRRECPPDLGRNPKSYLYRAAVNLSLDTLKARRRQPQAAYAANWRREFASLPPEDFPVTGALLDELPRVAGEEQFEFGLVALATGLASEAHKPSGRRLRNRRGAE